MIEPESEEFYVGYQAEAPSGLAALIRRVIVALLAISAIVSVIIVIGQQKFPASFFEFFVKQWIGLSSLLSQLLKFSVALFEVGIDFSLVREVECNRAIDLFER